MVVVCIPGAHAVGLLQWYDVSVPAVPTLRDFLSRPKAMRIAETNRLMITSTIRTTLVRVRKPPSTGSKAIT